MFVVVGTWRMDVRHETQQREGLTRIAAAVSQLPGIVRGYWTSSDDASESYTFIVFEDRATAELFAAEVRGNADNQNLAGVRNLDLVIHEITAETSGPVLA